MTNVSVLQEERENKLAGILKDERGLTMIELLATVVILAIILGVGAMAIGQVIQNSREDGTVAEVQNMYQAATVYLSSTEGALKGEAGSFTLEDVVKSKYYTPQEKNIDKTKHALVKFLVATDGAVSVYVPTGVLKAAKTNATKDLGTATEGLTRDKINNLTRSDVFGAVTPPPGG